MVMWIKSTRFRIDPVDHLGSNNRELVFITIKLCGTGLLMKSGDQRPNFNAHLWEQLNCRWA